MELTFNMNGNKKQAVDAEKVYDVLVIGAGPAGLNAALYAKRKGMEVAVMGAKSGGQVMDTSSVENYLGIQDATGESLVSNFLDHVKTLDIPILKDEQVRAISKSNGVFEVNASNRLTYRGKTVILATGSKPRELGVKGESEYRGRGVAYCAICDGPLFQGMDVIVAGGGNSAVEAAIDLAKIANSVKLVHRSQLRADQIVIDKLSEFDNVSVYLETQIVEVVGEQLVKGVKVLDKKTGEENFLGAEGIFVEIGYLPNNELAQGLVELNDRGEVIVDSKNQTDVEGFYAAGDVTDVPYKQIIISASEGAKAALTANDYLNRNA